MLSVMLLLDANKSQLSVLTLTTVLSLDATLPTKLDATSKLQETAALVLSVLPPVLPLVPWLELL
jgi:hypothetical protein